MNVPNFVEQHVIGLHVSAKTERKSGLELLAQPDADKVEDEEEQLRASGLEEEVEQRTTK